ncbi:MAG: hypothetical protein WC489_06280 [Patescibacteria group bacterium]|jgi:hypothetical protein
MAYIKPRSDEAKKFYTKLEAAAKAYQKLPLNYQGRDRQKKMTEKLQKEMVKTLNEMESRKRDLEQDIMNFRVTVEGYGPGHGTDVAGIYSWFTGKQIRKKELM